MNIWRTTASFPPQLTALTAAMLAGLCVVASVDAVQLPRSEVLAVFDAPGGKRIVQPDLGAAAARHSVPTTHRP